RGAIAMTETGLQNAGVAAIAGLVALGDRREQLGDDLFVAQIRNRLAAGVQIAALAEGDQLLGHRTKVLGLRQDGLDLLMLQQGNGEIGEKGLTGSSGAVQLATAHTMTHCLHSSTRALHTTPIKTNPPPRPKPGTAGVTN